MFTKEEDSFQCKDIGMVVGGGAWFQLVSGSVLIWGYVFWSVMEDDFI